MAHRLIGGFDSHLFIVVTDTPQHYKWIYLTTPQVTDIRICAGQVVKIRRSAVVPNNMNQQDAKRDVPWPKCVLVYENERDQLANCLKKFVRTCCLYLETRLPLSVSRDYDYSIVNNIPSAFSNMSINLLWTLQK